uniref:Nuclear factor, interleukin 3 regulated, member 4 n=1 Tax=Neogobius melanostomus TaxID=47308 RepID=A0A8C6STS3_9GOBI
MESLSPNFESGQSILALHADNEVTRRGSRRKREFIPDEQKDNLYWEKRRKNNEAAKRSREKRRLSDYVVETHLMALKEENTRLRAEMMAIKIHFGLAHPAAYTAYQLSHLQEQARGGAQGRTSHLAMQMDYWRSQESPLLSYTQPPHVFIPPLPTRSNPYLNQQSGAGSSLFTPLMYPKSLQPTLHQADVRVLRPSPRKDLWDEDEQQVPRVSTLSGPTQTPKQNNHVYYKKNLALV